MTRGSSRGIGEDEEKEFISVALSTTLSGRWRAPERRVASAHATSPSQSDSPMVAYWSHENIADVDRIALSNHRSDILVNAKS